MKYIKINNWEKSQHYKSRRPPWIRLYTDIIEKYDSKGEQKKFRKMPDDAKLTMLLLLCVASKFDNNIPYESASELASIMGIKEINLKPLIINNYINILSNDSDSASNPASNLASIPETKFAPESETDTDTETEKEQQPEPEIEIPEDDIPIPLTKPKKEAALPPAEAGFLKKFSGNHFSNKVGDYLNSIVNHAEKISTLNGKHGPPFNPYKFIQYQIKNKSHPGAIMETLEALVTQWPGIKNIWAYGELVIKTKNGNWHEKETITDYREVNQAWDNVLKKNPKLNKLILQAMKGL